MEIVAGVLIILVGGLVIRCQYEEQVAKYRARKGE